MIVGILVVSGIGYETVHTLSTPKEEVRYVLAGVQKGTLINSVSGSGQISVSTQVDIKSKGSGEVINLLVKNGQEVKNGAVLVQLNARDALKNVRDAQTSLESAQLSLEKLKNSITQASLNQAENTLTAAKTNLEKLKLSQEISYQKAEETKQKAEDSSKKTYEDALSEISDVFLDLPTVISGLHDVLYSQTITHTEDNTSALINSSESEYREELMGFQQSAQNDYQKARVLYEKNFEEYKSVSRYSDNTSIEALLSQTLETTKSIAQATKSEINYLDSWVDYRTRKKREVFSSVTSYQGDLATSLGKVNSHLSSLISSQRTLQDNREAIVNAERDLKEMTQNNPLDVAAAEASIKEKEESLATLKKGVDPLDIRSQEITVQQRRIALADAQATLGDYTVRAPFDGIVAKIDLRKGEDVSTGGTIATLITKQKIAEISLNEVDAAKIKEGQKATLTFDAVEGLTLTGQVGEIDTLGTVNQGVVSYSVKILFDTQDERIKSGMTVSASIVTDIKTDVLLVENSAIKNQGTNTYVEMLENIVSATGKDSTAGVTSKTLPREQSITTGIANDTQTQIVSGLKEGDQVIVRTITPSTNTSKTTQSAPSLLGGSSGGNRNFGGPGLRP